VIINLSIKDFDFFKYRTELTDRENQLITDCFRRWQRKLLTKFTSERFRQYWEIFVIRAVGVAYVKKKEKRKGNRYSSIALSTRDCNKLIIKKFRVARNIRNTLLDVTSSLFLELLDKMPNYCLWFPTICTTKLIIFKVTLNSQN